MRRDVQGLLVVLVGTLLLRLAGSGSYQRYVKPSMGRWLTVAGALLVLAGAWTLIHVPRATGVPADHRQAGDGHVHGVGWAPWLLLVPVLTVFLVAPPPLGSYAVSRNRADLPRPGQPFPALHGDPAQLGLLDFSQRAVWDDGRTLRGHRVAMDGFVTEGPAGTWYLTRILISCCAADGQAFQVKVLDAAAPTRDTWVRVVGTWVPGGGTRRYDAVPWLRATSVVPIEQPADPYG